MGAPVFPSGLLSFRRRVQDGRVAFPSFCAGRVWMVEWSGEWRLYWCAPDGEVLFRGWGWGLPEVGPDPVDELIGRAFSRWLEN